MIAECVESSGETWFCDEGLVVVRDELVGELLE